MSDIIYGFGSVEEIISQSGSVIGSDKIKMVWSHDLTNWNEMVVLDLPGWTVLGTSVCRGRNGYVMAIEVGEPKELVGERFTAFFAESNDLFNWKLMPYDCAYTKLRYIGCPMIRYSNDGYYYMIHLEALPLARYAPYIVRTKDFDIWEIGLHNPIMFWDDEDRKPKPGVYFSPDELDQIKTRLNINNSNVNLCEFAGYTYITYSTGDQLSFGCLCEAIYDGPLDQFFQAFFT